MGLNLFNIHVERNYSFISKMLRGGCSVLFPCSLKERNLLVVAAAQAEEKEREHVQDEIEEVEKHVFAILPKLEGCSNPNQQQVRQSFNASEVWR